MEGQGMESLPPSPDIVADSYAQRRLQDVVVKLRLDVLNDDLFAGKV